jgi:hypothetical protein
VSRRQFAARDPAQDRTPQAVLRLFRSGFDTVTIATWLHWMIPLSISRPDEPRVLRALEQARAEEREQGRRA